MNLPNQGQPISIEKLLQTIGMLFVQSQIQMEQIQKLEAEKQESWKKSSLK
jgi:hypothetical protein